MEKQIYLQMIAILAALLVVTGTASAYYYSRYAQEAAANRGNAAEISRLLSKYHLNLASNILIDFENGTRHWYNGTVIQPGWNLYTATLVITNGNVNATCCEFSSHFVTGIDGVQNEPTQNRAWLAWTYNATSFWLTAQVGVDQVTMVNGSAYAWTFCRYDPNTGAPLCPKP